MNHAQYTGKNHRSLRNKLRSQGGETIVEVLASAMMIVLSFLFLASAVTVSGRVNEQFQAEDIVFHLGSSDMTVVQENYQVLLSSDTTPDPDLAIQLPARLYRTTDTSEESGFYFYEYSTSTTPPGG